MKHLNVLGKLAEAQSCRKDGRGVIITHQQEGLQIRGYKFGVKWTQGRCPAKG